MATSIADLQKLYGSNNLGKFKVYQSTGADAQYGNFLYIPAAGNFRGGYFNIDQATIDTLPQGSYEEGGPMLQRLEGGINRAAFSDALMGQITNGNMVNSGNQSFDNISNQVKDAIKMTKEVPTYTNETVVGATPSVPAGSAGAKLQAALKANPNLTPEQQLAASGGTTGGTTGGTATPAYKDAQGNVFDAQGNYISWDAIPKGADGKPIANLDILPVKEAPGGTTQTGVTGAQYLRQKGTNDVFAIVNGGAYYVPYDYAVANNVFSQVQEIDGRVDQKYPIAGNVSQLPTSGNNTQGGANLGQQDYKEGDYVPGKGTLQPDGTYKPTQPGDQIGTTGATVRDYTSPPASSTIPLDIWNQLSEMDKAMVYYTDDERKSQIASGQANISINNDTLHKALIRATDEMTSKYGEVAKMASASLANNLSLINAEFGQTYNATIQKQKEDQRKLAENYASIGAQQSGFREKAKGQLATEQQGVISSSKRQLQQQYNQLGSQYESLYGSGALPGITNSLDNSVAYNPVGNITGSQEYAKQADILSKQQSIYNLEKSPLS